MMRVVLQLTVGVVLLVAPVPLALAQTAPKMIATLRADGNYKKAPKGVVKGDVRFAPKKDKALLMTGKYAPTEYVTAFRLPVPALNYNSFTVVSRVKFHESDKEEMAIFVGGAAFRWALLERVKPGGNLSVRLNNGDFVKVTTLKTKLGEWLTVALAVDLKNKRVRIALNGEVAEVTLPDDFSLKVLESDMAAADKAFLFTDFSRGSCMSGLVEELTVYNQAMSKEEIEKATKSKEKK